LNAGGAVWRDQGGGGTVTLTVRMEESCCWVVSTRPTSLANTHGEGGNRTWVGAVCKGGGGLRDPGCKDGRQLLLGGVNTAHFTGEHTW
jgi:hypothetical protein